MTCLHDFMTALMAEKEAINKAANNSNNNYATTAKDSPHHPEDEPTAEYDSSSSSIGTQSSTNNINNSLRSCSRTVPVNNNGSGGRRTSESLSGVIKLIYIVPDNAHMSPSRRLRKPRSFKSYSDPNLTSLGDKSPVSVLKTSVFDMAPILPTKRTSSSPFELVSDNSLTASSRRVRSSSAGAAPSSSSAAARSKARAALRAEMLLDIAPTPPMKTNSGGIDTLMEGLQSQEQGGEVGALSPSGRRSRSFEDLHSGRSTRSRTPMLSRQERRQLQQQRNLKTNDRREWQHRSHDDLISRSKNTPSSPLLGGCRWMEHLTEAKAYAADNMDASSSSISSMQNHVWSSTSGSTTSTAQKQKKKNTPHHHQMPMKLPTRSFDENEQQQGEVVVDAGRNMVNAVMKLSYQAAYTLTKDGSNWNNHPATTTTVVHQ